VAKLKLEDLQLDGAEHQRGAGGAECDQPGDLTSSVDVSVDGNVALNVLSGVLVARVTSRSGWGR
jgi:hypothetical protein